METKNSISIKRSIAIKAVVTPTWKEDAEKELSKAISNIDQQLSQLEQEMQTETKIFKLTTIRVCSRDAFLK